MRLYELRDQEGRVFAFEINNTYFGRNSVCDVLLTISGARLIRGPRTLS